MVRKAINAFEDIWSDAYFNCFLKIKLSQSIVDKISKVTFSFFLVFP